MYITTQGENLVQKILSDCHQEQSDSLSKVTTSFSLDEVIKNYGY